MSDFHARGAFVNLMPNSLRVEDVEEKLVQPWNAGLFRDQAKPLVMEKPTRLGSKDWTAEESGRLFCHCH